MSRTAELIAYLECAGPDARGRFLQDQWDWDDERMEATHDYIQWWFPLPDRSVFNPLAPTPDEEALASLSPSARAALARSVRRFREFLDRSSDWLDAYDHNHQRVSRMLLCLTLAGEADLARETHDALLAKVRAHCARTGRPGPSAEALEYWSSALLGLNSPP